MGSDQPDSAFEHPLKDPDEQFDPEGVMLTGVLREIESEARAAASARAGVRPEVLIVGRVLAERWYSAHDDGAECTEMAERVVAALERSGRLADSSGLATGASGNRSSAAAGGRTGPTEGDVNTRAVETATAAVLERVRTSAGIDQVPAVRAAAIRRQVKVAVAVAAPLIQAAALRAYADRSHPAAEGVSYPTDYGTGIEYDTVCTGCGASWCEDEGGCTERAQILADAEQIEGAR